MRISTFGSGTARTCGTDASAIRRRVLLVVREEPVVPDKREDVIGGIDGGDEESDLTDFPRDPTRGDRVADLERPERQKEEAGGKVREEPGPCGTNCNTSSRQEGGEGRRLDAKHSEHCDEHQQLQDDARAGVEIAGQRDVHVAHLHRAPQTGPEESNGVVADEPDRNAACDLPGHRDEVQANEGIHLRGEVDWHEKSRAR